MNLSPEILVLIITHSNQINFALQFWQNISFVFLLQQSRPHHRFDSANGVYFVTHPSQACLAQFSYIGGANICLWYQPINKPSLCISFFSVCSYNGSFPICDLVTVKNPNKRIFIFLQNSQSEVTRSKCRPVWHMRLAQYIGLRLDLSKNYC